MKIVVSHPTGNRNVREVLAGFHRHQMLAEFNTTIAVNKGSALLNLLPASLKNEVNRRHFTIPAGLIKAHPWRETIRMAMTRLKMKSLVEHENSYASIDTVYQELDRSTARRLPKLIADKKISAVYCYEDGAYDTFKRAKDLGLTCIYDLPIAFWETRKKLMNEEAERLPAWACTLGGGLTDSQQKLERKSRELELADMVIGPGEFVFNSIPSWASGKTIRMVPFGSPAGATAIDDERKHKDGRAALRVLFAGSLGQRKGLGDLFAAMRMLKDVDIELVVMGSLLAPMDFYRNEYADFKYEAGRPNTEVLALMRSCDVFCLPSIAEGRALVVQEAMSQGLPILITPNTGGEDLVIEGQTGFLVPIRSPHAIAEKLNWFFENRNSIPLMGKKAKEHAMTYTWDNYSEKIVSAINGMKGQ